MKTKKITKYWRISKILDAVPDSVEAMMEFGLHCFGCAANTQERLHEGMKVHGFDEDEVNNLVEQINQIYADQQKQENKLAEPDENDFYLEQEIKDGQPSYQLAGLNFTQAAFDAIHELSQGKKALFIKVEAGGCNGYSYTYDYSQKPESGQHTFTLSPDMDILMDTFSYNKLKGSQVDFKGGLHGSGLTFTNPNTKSECHCGASVGF